MLDQVEKAKSDFIRNTGQEPKYLYLGRRESKIIWKWANDNGYNESHISNGEGVYRPEFSGLYVYQVNSDNHFTVV